MQCCFRCAFDHLICECLQQDSDMSKAAIFEAGELCNQVMFLVGGRCAYVPAEDDDIFRTPETLHENRIMCEPALWCEWHHVGDLHTITPVSRLVLNFRDVEVLVVRYPLMRAWGSSHAAILCKL